MLRFGLEVRVIPDAEAEICGVLEVRFRVDVAAEVSASCWRVERAMVWVDVVVAIVEIEAPKK